MKKEDIVSFAQRQRKINSDPFESANSLGYDVAYIEDPDKIFIVKTVINNNQTHIIINKSLDLSRRMVYCTRELGHLIFNTKSEHEVNLFAVAYLYDEKDFEIRFVNMSNGLLVALLSTYYAETAIFTPEIISNNCIVDSLGNPISDIKNISIEVSEVNDWMLNELNKNPNDLYKLSSRRFEELVAEVLMRKGYSVELTPATRDGGKDIYVAYKNDFGSFLYIVECKKYKPTHKVGVNVLRDLYGVLSKERATYAIAVTTSYFSKPAKDFQQELQFQMSLQDFDSIKQWLCDVT